ncbi:MAG: hypothetical protein ACRD1Z_15185 [Vicinamibacteria bacterium]
MTLGIASWGILGEAFQLSRALYHLTPLALEAIVSSSLGLPHWLALLVWVAFNAYAEGYVGFHQKFSPRVVGRALDLGRNPTLLRVVFAAPYCIGLFHAPRKTMVTSWTLVLVIAFVVFGVRLLPQPWRGIIDAGVVVGLGIGLVSLLARFVSALSGGGAAPRET